MVRDLVGDARPAGLVLGIGDDAALWRCTSRWEVATTDSLVQDVHFSLAYTTWRDLGWKALAVNLSDIAAMGAAPTYALVSLSLPGDIEVSSIAEFYAGMLDLAGQHGVTIVGGNFSAAPVVVISVMVLGSLEPEASATGIALQRSGAAVGDLIGVTGYLGLAAGGLRLLGGNTARTIEAEPLVGAHLRPTPRVNEGRVLRHKGVKAAIDVSDGLLLDLGRLCEASGVGAQLRASQIPVHPLLQAHFSNPLPLVLSGGEDYELLFTAPPLLMDEVRESLEVPVAVIGEVVAGKGIALLDEEGRYLDIVEKGWEHFKSHERIENDDPS